MEANIGSNTVGFEDLKVEGRTARPLEVKVIGKPLLEGLEKIRRTARNNVIILQCWLIVRSSVSPWCEPKAYYVGKYCGIEGLDGFGKGMGLD